MNSSRHHISPPPSEEYGFGSRSAPRSPGEKNSDEISLLPQQSQSLSQSEAQQRQRSERRDEESGSNEAASEEGNPTAAAATRIRNYGKVNLFFGFFS
jgi:hypothetical protein